MAVYVDEPIWEWRGRRWCHLVGDESDELHGFAARLGLRRAWFQEKRNRPWHDHYDIPAEVRALALDLGALPLSTRQMGALQARRREVARLDPAR